MHSSSIPNGAPVRSSQNETIMYTQRLLPQVVDSFAKEDPTHVLGMAAKTEDPSQGFTSITTSQLSHAVNFTAHWLESQTCITSRSTETISYIGSQDFRYWVLELASIKVGHPLLLPSPKNALANTVSLLELTNCKVLFYSLLMKEQAVALSKLVPGLDIVQVPTLPEMVNQDWMPYPYTKSWGEAKDDVILIVHTSGSTGVPKPIFYTNKWIGKCVDSRELVPSLPGRTLANLSLLKRKKLFFTGTPFFHLSGILFGFLPMFCQTTAVMGPPDIPPSGKMVRDMVKTIKLSGIISVPSLLDAMFSEDAGELLPFLTEVEHICWLGGPLGTPTGDWIIKNSKVHLWQIYGSTEVGPLQMVIPPRSHWQYMEFHPTVGPTLERLAPDSDLYEVVSHRQPAHEWSRPVFDAFPQIEEWRSRDILSRCKDAGYENLWKYEGRLDDMMLLSNGLKVNPLHIETRLQSHSALNGCLVIGYGYTKCGLLIEPKDPNIEKEAVVEQLWAAVEDANALVPEHARIDKRFVVMAGLDKPLPRASKGTIIRSLATRAYEGEIGEVYRAAG